MDEKQLLKSPQDFRTFVMTTRTLYWVIITMRNRGIPDHILDPLRQAEEAMKIQASISPHYKEMNSAVEALINTYHSGEPEELQGKQEDLWLASKPRIETWRTLNNCIMALANGVATKKMFELVLDVSSLEKIHDGLKLVTDWLIKMKDSEDDEPLRKAIDDLFSDR